MQTFSTSGQHGAKALFRLSKFKNSSPIIMQKLLNHSSKGLIAAEWVAGCKSCIGFGFVIRKSQRNAYNGSLVKKNVLLNSKKPNVGPHRFKEESFQLAWHSFYD